MRTSRSWKQQTPPTPISWCPSSATTRRPIFGGDAVGVLFRALERGYSMAATMHADTAEEVTTMLGVHVPLALVHHVDVVVNLRLLSGAGGMMRRVDQVSLVTPGPRHTSVAQWDAHSDTFALAGPDDTLNALAAHAGMGPGDTEDDLARRAERLRSWLELGHLSAVEVEQMVARHYEPSG